MKTANVSFLPVSLCVFCANTRNRSSALGRRQERIKKHERARRREWKKRRINSSGIAMPRHMRGKLEHPVHLLDSGVYVSVHKHRGAWDINRDCRASTYRVSRKTAAPRAWDARNNGFEIFACEEDRFFSRDLATDFPWMNHSDSLKGRGRRHNAIPRALLTNAVTLSPTKLIVYRRLMSLFFARASNKCRAAFGIYNTTTMLIIKEF